MDDLAREHWSDLVRLGYQLTHNPDQAKDLAQDCLLAVTRRLKRDTSPIDNLTAYARTTLLHLYLRGRDGRRNQPDESATEAHLPAVPDPAEQVIERSLLWSLLASLSPRDRAVLVQRYYLGDDDQTIADALGCTRSAVRSIAQRALARIRTGNHLTPDPVGD